MPNEWSLSEAEIEELSKEYANRGSVQFLHVERSYLDEIVPFFLQAQLREVVKRLTSPPFQDYSAPFLTFTMTRNDWQQLRKEAGLE